MYNARFLLNLLLAAYFLVHIEARGGRGRKDYHVVDGDTIKHGSERIRLADIYAAELNEHGGQRARENLQEIINGGDVHVERKGQDRYGRTLADVYVGDHRISQNDVGPRAGRGSSRPRRPR